MESKCFRKRCNWSREVAHMDEALVQLQQHFRAVHPSKGFYRNRECEALEGWNQTAEEILEANNLAAMDAEPQYDWVRLRSQVRRWQEDVAFTYVHPDAVAELARKVEEHFAAHPEAQGVNPNAAPPGLRQWINDGIQRVVPPFEVLEEEAYLDVPPLDVIPGDNGR